MKSLEAVLRLIAIECKNLEVIERIILYSLLLIMITAVYHIVLIVHEGGHAIFGILTGYKITIFRIENMSFISEGGKVRLKFYQSYASAGQCVLCPPSVRKREEVPFVLHTLGGIIGNVILCIISVLLLLCSSDMNYIAEVFFILLFLISLLCAIVNTVPCNVTISNDGYNLKLLRSSVQTRRSLYYQLNIISKLCKGLTYKELPEKMVIVPRPSDLTNSILVWHQMMVYYRYLDNDRWTDAFEYMNEIEKYSYKCPMSLKKTVQAEKLFLMIKLNFSSNEIEELYEQIKKLIRNKKADFQLVKVRMAYEIYKENCPKTKERIMAELQVKSHTYPCKGESLLCIKLIKGMMT